MKIGLVSLGCPKNLVDSEVMLGLAQQAGHELTRDASDADVLVVNTCAFIDSAKQESIDTILEMAQHKKNGRCTRLVVTGCMAERYRDELKKEIPEIDAVLGTGEVPQIVEAIGADARLKPRAPSAAPSTAPLTFFATRATAPSTEHPALGTRHPALGTGHPAPEHPAPDTQHPAPAPSTKHPAPSTPSYIYDADTPRLLATPTHYAYVKIAEGCDYKCAFCIIPTLRGAYRSRPAESIVREARRLASQGVKELLLISQDTTFYGIDRQERGALARLLRALNEVDGLEWIRLLYLYPTTIDDDTLAAMAECDKVCNYIDLPLQHASDPVLKRMKRPGTRKGYDALLGKIRGRVPGVALRTTFIVGFPGETDADVDALCGFVGDHGFDHVGVFTYSHEDGTSAYALTDDVAARTKSARRARVMALQKGLVTRRQRARIGERTRIVVDGPSAEHDLVLKGRLMTQAPDIDASVFLTECDPSSFRSGDFADVEIVGAREYDLVARPLP
jgi:ribosomal protein S12 methylthiotransferase